LSTVTSGKSLGPKPPCLEKHLRAEDERLAVAL